MATGCICLVGYYIIALVLVFKPNFMTFHFQLSASEYSSRKQDVEYLYSWGLELIAHPQLLSYLETRVPNR